MRLATAVSRYQFDFTTIMLETGPDGQPAKHDICPGNQVLELMGRVSQDDILGKANGQPAEYIDDNLTLSAFSMGCYEDHVVG